MAEKHVLDMFIQWDGAGDGDGWIQEDELVKALGIVGISAEDARILFKNADSNSDGKIDYEEFVNWLFKGAAPDKVKEITHTDLAHRSLRGKAVTAAKKAVGAVKGQLYTELAAKVVPPRGGLEVVAALLWLFGEFPDLTPPVSKKKKKIKFDPNEVIWAQARKVMGKANFVRRLHNFDVASVTPEMLKNIEPYTSQESFNADKILARGGGQAPAALCDWILLMKKAAETDPSAE
eukprot:TRINITY_DN26233_c0_g1_i1.p1 TRINITY_DN26233_c0_g1~~TRINITY_DN26233_c0_g1_i1.p1  ORF type:complete len:235 (-),score=62.79 TRINITY_DN26233_c0_g1_i1:189-893(-)